VAQQKLFAKDYAPTATVDVEAPLVERARKAKGKLNWKESAVDLMKLLNMDSSLGARKRLAQQMGYQGTLDGSAKMNIWLYQQMVKKIRKNGAVLPEDLRDEPQQGS
jgi:hypothetical protein